MTLRSLITNMIHMRYHSLLLNGPPNKLVVPKQSADPRHQSPEGADWDTGGKAYLAALVHLCFVTSYRIDFDDPPLSTGSYDGDTYYTSSAVTAIRS
jgi:hypothetical protein